MAVWVLRGRLFTLFLSMAISWRHISQGRVATRLVCGGSLTIYHFTANLSPSLTVKEFWKSVQIWQSCRHEFGGLLFWNTVYSALEALRDYALVNDIDIGEHHSALLWHFCDVCVLIQRTSTVSTKLRGRYALRTVRTGRTYGCQKCTRTWAACPARMYE